MEKMYRGVTNSPKTELVALITETDTEIEVNDISVLLPNEGIAVIGNGDVAETIKYSQVEGNILKDCIRGYEGIARSWTAGTRVARNFAASDWNTAIDNIEGLYGRLDDEKTVPLTLQPGLQVVTSAKDARFKLGQITGKTEINGQGRTGIIGVENPYVIGVSGNLLPPLYEYEGITNPSSEWSFNSDYEAVQKTASTEGHYIKFQIDVEPDMEYTLSCEHNGYMAVTTRDGTTQIVPWTNSQEVTINPNDSIIYIFFGNYNGSTGVAGAYTFKNPMLTIGAEPKPFEPQRKSVLAFQTELHANPTDGSDPDILFEQNGQYFKLAKWKKVVLDGSLNYTVYGSKDGFRTISTPVPGAVYPSTVTDTIGEMTKYDGKLLTKNDAFNINDSWYLNGAIKSAILSIPSADSGWGDDYEPTQDEVKAYFNGYKMFTVGQGHTSTYNGTGVKAWVAIIDISAPEGPADTQILPTGTYSQWTPYQLLYRLAKESVEPIVSEGSLLLTEGDNMVEVGTGIVLRERVTPVLGGDGNWFINEMTLPQSRTTYPVSKHLGIYRNSLLDNMWILLTTGNTHGAERAYIPGVDFDQSAAYSVTYLKLDKSPIQPITGSLAANEKAQISDLTAGVAEALQRVSVVEMKKAEEDTPGWITPTLLNGATSYGPFTPQYMKQGDRVYLRGQVVLAALGTTVFKLPEDYRPDRDMRFLGYSYSTQPTSGEIVVTSAGDVSIPTGGLAATSFDGISFLAK